MANDRKPRRGAMAEGADSAAAELVRLGLPQQQAERAAEALSRASAERESRPTPPPPTFPLMESDLVPLAIELSSERDPAVRRVVAAALAITRMRPHRTGWIRYGRDELLSIAGLRRLTSKEAAEATAAAHSRHGLSMAVVGAKRPVACLRLDWATEPSGRSATLPADGSWGDASDWGKGPSAEGARAASEAMASRGAAR